MKGNFVLSLFGLFKILIWKVLLLRAEIAGKNLMENGYVRKHVKAADMFRMAGQQASYSNKTTCFTAERKVKGGERTKWPFTYFMPLWINRLGAKVKGQRKWREKFVDASAKMSVSSYSTDDMALGKVCLVPFPPRVSEPKIAWEPFKARWEKVPSKYYV